MTKVTHKVCVKCERRLTLRNFLSARARVCFDCQKTRAKAYRRNRHVESNYGLTEEEYLALVKHQGGACHLCGERRAAGYAWHVDHDHSAERDYGVRASIRGLVCARCNTLLRRARDKPRVFLGGYHYLTSWFTMDIFDFVKGYMP